MASLAESVPESPEVVVTEESAVSVMEPAVGVLRTGGALLSDVLLVTEVLLSDAASLPALS